MLESMPNRVFNEWMRYYKEEPFGEARADLRMGILAANILTAISALSAQISGRKGAKGKVFRPADFMPYEGNRRSRVVSPDMQFKKLLLINKFLGGTVIDKRKQ